MAGELDRVDDVVLASQLRSTLEKLAHWPKGLCSGEVCHCYWSSREEQEAKHGPVARWLWELFDGVFNPRLVVLEEASLTCELEYRRQEDDPLNRKGWGKQTQQSLALALARHLDPTFSYPHVLLSRNEERTPDTEEILERFGDDKTGFVHTEYAIEHAVDLTCGHRYEPYGLAVGTIVGLDIFTRSDSWTYKAWMSGPAPAILDLALAWGELLRSGPVILDGESIADIAARRRNT